MSGLLASSVPLAAIAYAQVRKDGTSPDLNSGVATDTTGTGTYTIDLPANLAQALHRDIVLLTPRIDDDVGPNLYCPNYQWNSTTQIQVNIWNSGGGEGAQLADCAFDFVLLRSTITPVVDEPA